MLNTTFSPWPNYSKEETDLVSKVLLSNKVNFWTGTEIRSFESEFSEFSSAKHSIALANGTLALDLAFHALGIGQGDEVIVTSRTFLASASSIVNSRAKPVFADVDQDTQNITAETIAPLITPNTKAILCVHLGGWPCEMDAILDLAKAHNLYVVEDCAQAHGATYRGRSVGSFGNANAWSFCQDKIMTTGGEGGMLTTNNETLWKKAWAYKDHGKSWDAVYNREHPPGFRWLHESFGTNWRLTEMQAAIGRYQIQQMPEWHRKRSEYAGILNRAFSSVDCLRTAIPPEHIQHAYYKYYVFVRPECLAEGWSRDRIIHEITQKGIPCFSGSCSEVYLEKAFDGTGLRPEKRLPVAKELGETSLMFLVHPTLSAADIEQFAEVAVDICKQATR